MEGVAPATRVLVVDGSSGIEAAFTDPHRFDLRRSPNPHVGFGGLGPRYCLGNQLAKVELRHLFRELLTRRRRIEFGEPDLLQSSFVHGIKRPPVALGGSNHRRGARH